MISSKFFRKQFLIVAATVFTCVFLGTSLLSVIVRLTFPKPETRVERKFPTPSLFPNFVEREGAGDLVRGIKRLESYIDPDDAIHLTLLNEAGKALYPAGARGVPVEKLPAGKHEGRPLDGPGGGLNPSVSMVIRLDHQPARFLMVEFPMIPPSRHGGPHGQGDFHDGPHGGPPMDGPPPFGGPDGMPPPPPGMHPSPWFFPASFLTLALMVLVGIGIALAILFRSLRAAGDQADHVISELKNGNLKARFPMGRSDEIGQAMQRFNSMADEIEGLVDKLRLAENSRNNLLQELAHDLRTPVASLRTIQEGLFRSVTMSPEERELSELAEKEVDYLGRLVEDLLLLAQLTEPRFKASRGLVDLLSLLEEECEALAPAHDAKIEVVTHFKVDQALVQGDEHLFQRLIRNALENAFSYSRRRIDVVVSPGPKGGVVVRISDDGEGFTPEALAKFGERRDQRVFRAGLHARLSLGLGSVIMKSVVSLHGGQIRATNAPEGGAVVEFSLPGGA